ncbi:unnamed protein product [Vicia faba]|uniref:SAUR-like auxin-responsive protein family n=1 Tax=Vicia faba TaxID=3906 RepID=A0AAV1B4C3_VICFA|nr:unnamed protein product [Vicia faba]
MTEIKKVVVDGVLKFKNNVFKKVQKCLLMERNDDKSKDVKKGHFVVMAEDEEEIKRFVVPLRVLTNPMFVRLLEQAGEKYGFKGNGALTVPCRPNEFQMLMLLGENN